MKQSPLRRLGPRRWVAVFAALLLALELGLRSQGYASLPVTGVHAELGWTLLPNQDRAGRYGESLRINGYGMRDRDWAPPGAASASVHEGGRAGLRVVVLGDSRPYGFGVQVGDTFPRRLEATLAASRGDALVMNFGQPGYHLAQFVKLYESVVRAWRPDVVIVCVGTIAITPPLPPLVARRFPLQSLVVRTALWDALDRKWLLAAHGRAAHEHWVRTGQLEAAEAAQRGFRIARDSPWSDEARPLWDAAGVDLGRLAALTAEDDARLLCLVLPRKGELAPDVAAELATRWATLAAARGTDTTGTATAVELVDVTGDLAAIDGPFLASDTEHLTPAGHACVAAALAQVIGRDLAERPAPY